MSRERAFQSFNRRIVVPTIRILGQLNAGLRTEWSQIEELEASVAQLLDEAKSRADAHTPPEKREAWEKTWTFNSRSGGFTIPYQLRYGDFDVQLECPTVGDYSIDDRVVVERKTYADFATSLVDGRLFPQAAALARCSYRPVILLEGPTPSPCCERRRERALRFRIAKSAC